MINSENHNFETESLSDPQVINAPLLQREIIIHFQASCCFSSGKKRCALRGRSAGNQLYIVWFAVGDRTFDGFCLLLTLSRSCFDYKLSRKKLTGKVLSGTNNRKLMKSSSPTYEYFFYHIYLLISYDKYVLSVIFIWFLFTCGNIHKLESIYRIFLCFILYNKICYLNIVEDLFIYLHLIIFLCRPLFIELEYNLHYNL